MIERTRISDIILLKHGIKIVDLKLAIDQFNLAEDEDYKLLITRFKAEIMMKDAKLSSEQEALVAQVCADGSNEIDRTLESSGVLKFEEYIKIFRLIV